MIHISEKLIIQIELEAEKAYPNECCGIIVGAIKNDKKYAVQILASINDSAKSEQYHRFIITPETMLKAEQLARLIHLDIIGFYHSHPDCPAVPSEYDTTHALPVYSYIIVSVVNGKALEFTSWELDKAADYKEFQNEAVNTSRREIMAVTVFIPTTLRIFTNQRSEVELEGQTVGKIIEALSDEYPETKKALFDESGKLRPFVNIFLNANNIKNLQGYETPVKDGDEIMLIPAIAGGASNDSILGDRKGEKLTNDEIQRYSRHLLLKEVGVKGQKRLKAAKVLIVGLGGLGAPLAQYLAAAGVGTIGLMDFDEVEESNLQRQVIHGTRDIGRPKVASAKDSIRQINPLVKVETYNYPITSENAIDIIGEYDVVADASDNYKTRYLVNDACVLLGKPDVFGAMYQFEGQATVYYGKEGPCYRCMYPAPPPPGLVPSCATGGVVGVLPGIIGTIQANEVIKLIVGGGNPLIGRLVTFDAWHMKWRELKICKDPSCPVCGTNPSITELEEYDYEDFCGIRQQKEENEAVEAIEAKELKRRLDEGEKITLIDVREPHERAIVKFLDAKAIPIGQLARRQNELDPNADTVFICKEGKRSILAVNTLREAGYTGKMYNLKDGTNAWARDVDPSFPKY